MKRAFIIIIASLLLFTACRTKESAGVGITQGKQAPDFTLKNIDGEDVSLSDYKGKVVVVNFFGVWCSWCIKEMPGFVKVFDEYKDKGVELLVVDNGDDRETVLSYLNENNFDIKPVLDEKGEVVNTYKINGYPSSFILDEKGIIKYVHKGFMDENQLRTYLKAMGK